MNLVIVDKDGSETERHDDIYAESKDYGDIMVYSTKLVIESHNMEFPDDPWELKIENDEAAEGETETTEEDT